MLKEYIVKGFALDDELLKKGTRFGKDYFDHLLSRIREIRASERRFNQKITDLYVTSSDSDFHFINNSSKITLFFTLLETPL
jgi:hypothetical protein